MGKHIWILVGLGFAAACFINSSFAGEIGWSDIGRGNLNLKAVLVAQDNPQEIYIGSESGIFKTEDGGGTWRNIFSLKGTNRQVNFLAYAPGNNNSLYAATGSGLFYSANQGRNWKSVFQGKSYPESDCTTVAVAYAAVYLGTRAGLFISKDDGRTWRKAEGKLGSSHILAVAYGIDSPAYVYAACADGVFRSTNHGDAWEKVFSASPTENGDEGQEQGEDTDEAARFSAIRYICVVPGDINHLYLATARGVYETMDSGQSWERLPDYGLLSQDVRFIKAGTGQRLYGVTRSGIFEYKNERWKELSFTLPVSEVNSLGLDAGGNLYATCDKGLFKLQRENFAARTNDNIMAIYLEGEPKIEEVQKAAIEYAEVQPEKIREWRKQASRRAWFPQVSTGVNRNVTDLWHWETGSTTKADDDALRRGRDSVEWDISLTWDLSELIWNDDQTSIDVRSRLMVQLRNDILDEVTKIYFERLRVKMELDNLSIEERKKRLEKELRLKELTAELNGLTGGYFSAHLSG